MKLPILLSLASFLVSSLSAASVRLSANVASGVYQPGESIAVVAVIERDKNDDGSDALSIIVRQDNNDVIFETTFAHPATQVLVYEARFDAPQSIRIEAALGDAKDALGAVVAPAALSPGMPRPADFDAFWEQQKRTLAALPLEAALEPIPLGNADAGFEAFNVEINCPGPRPARAIFVKPAGAQPKSLPIIVNLHAAGVKGSWCRAHVSDALGNAKRGSGALSFDLNAHGMRNNQPDSYYEELENGPLKQYWEIGIEDRDAYYFRFMYLRLLRSIEFLARQPEWDGERILVIGESQGGGQALAAAGLDKRVSAVVATVPAMCDFGAPLAGRRGGWPQPVEWHRANEKALSAVGYFDAAHLLAGSTARLVVEIGLADDACPPAGIFAALNQAKGRKTIYPVPYRTHGWPEGPRRAEWDQTVLAAKQAFIDDYLK